MFELYCLFPFNMYDNGCCKARYTWQKICGSQGIHHWCVNPFANDMISICSKTRGNIPSNESWVYEMEDLRASLCVSNSSILFFHINRYVQILRDLRCRYSCEKYAKSIVVNPMVFWFLQMRKSNHSKWWLTPFICNELLEFLCKWAL